VGGLCEGERLKNSTPIRPDSRISHQRYPESLQMMVEGFKTFAPLQILEILMQHAG